MQKFRFVYWFGSITTEAYYKGENVEAALKIFREVHGNKKIYKIELIES